MRGVGPGTILGGRYELRHRLTQGRDFESWSAHDTTLEREVTLTIVSSRHRNRAGVLDAARRAAGVEDTRLVRILDVGTQKDSSFIVEEAMSGAESLATNLANGPLPAEEARRIAGESAKGLETAGQRGLHHLRLTPHYVMLAPDGTIRLRGVAVAAAIEGPDEQEPDAPTASLRDALCLAAVLYAALTGRWPLDEMVEDIEPAPKMVSGVVAPSEIAVGVPGDLDALCHLMLNEATGPVTPGDFVNQLAPWSHQQVHRDELEPTAVLHLPTGVIADAAQTSEVPASEVLASESGPEPTVAISPHDLPSQDPSSRSGDSAPEPDSTGQVATPTVGDKAAAAGAATTKAFGAALSSAGAAAGAVGDKLSSFARPGPDSTAPTDPDPAQMRLPTGLSAQLGDDGRPLPILPASTALPPSRGQSKIVMLVVALFVGLALFVGYRGLVGPGNSVESTAPPRRTVTASAPAVPAPASPTPTTEAQPAGPIAVLSATGFDPEGDQSEKDGQAARVYDGDLATSWTSEGYGTAEFGKLKKGAGVLLDLGQPTAVRQVTIDLGSGPADLTVYGARDPNLEGATVIGRAKAASGRIQVKASGAKPKSQYVIVWFTSLPADGSQFRAAISEIALS